MPRWLLYPQREFGDPETLGDLEAVKVEEFVQPFSEPLRALPGVLFAAVLASSFFIDPEALGESAVPADESTEWLPPFSEPLPRVAGLHASNQEAFVTDPETLGDPETDRLQWFVSLAEPVRPELRYQHEASFPDPETIGDAAALDTSVEWFVSFSEPVLPLGPLYATALAASGAVIDPEALGEVGVVDVAVTGGYTPYAVYDPRQERRIKDRRRKLRREREELHADLKRLISGEPAEAQEAPDRAKGRSKAAIADQPVPGAGQAPRRDRAAANADALHAVAISVRRVRLEALQNELLTLDTDLQVVQARARAEARDLARENELITILLLAS